MIDKRVQSLLTQKIKSIIGSNLPSISKEKEKIYREMASRGMLNSSFTKSKVFELCKKTIQQKSDIISVAIVQEINDLGIIPSDEYTDQMKNIARSLMPKDVEGIVHTIERSSIRIGSPMKSDERKKYKNDFSFTLTGCLNKLNNDIELSMEKLKLRIESENKNRKSQVINVNAPVGAIQTGDHSIAHITQNFDDSARDSLIKALEIIKTALEKECELPVRCGFGLMGVSG